MKDGSAQALPFFNQLRLLIAALVREHLKASPWGKLAKIGSKETIFD